MTPLNFGEGDFLSGFDAATGPNGFDLSGFDAADGRTSVPAGWYVGTLERGELVALKSGPKAGKPGYRLLFKVSARMDAETRKAADASCAGFAVWRTFPLTDRADFNRAWPKLAPVGLNSAAALHAPFPPAGKPVWVVALVSERKDTKPTSPYFGRLSNDLERLELTDPPDGFTPAVNPFAAPLPTAGEGGPQQ